MPTFDDEDDRIGVPRAGAAATLPTAPPQRTETLEEPTLRAGDHDLGRPPQLSPDVAPLSDAERKILADSAEAQALRDLAEAEELLASDPVAPWAGWFAHPLAAAFLLGSAGALGLFLYSQALAILANLAIQPPAIQYAGYAALAVFAGAVIVSAMRLVLVYARLSRNRQIRLRGLEELHNRTRLRWLAAAKSAEAKRRLEDYLRIYPLDSARDRKLLASAGVTEELAAQMAVARIALLDPTKFSSTTEWFDQFRLRFQTHQDAAAEARIGYWANRAMIVTAASPNGMIDSLATTYFGFAMLTDLCRAYHLRAGRTGTAVLLGRVFFNAYLAGSLGDFEKFAEDQYDHLFEQGFQVVGIGVGSNVATKFLGKVGAKATTGYLNRLLLLRLGKYACRLLRPVA